MADFGTEQPLKPLRLAFVCHALTPGEHGPERVGGAERAAADLLRALRRRGDLEVTTLIEAASIDRLKFVAFSWRTLGELSRLARTGAIDAVLFTALPTAWMALALKTVFRRAGVISASICHGHDVTMTLAPYQALVRRTLQALQLVLPVSRATGDCCLERGLDPGRMQVTYNGIDPGRFAAAPPAAARRALLEAAFPAAAARLPPNAMVLCSVGRQVRRKGHAWFIREVMPRLPADVRFWLAGGDGPEAQAIGAAIEAAGVRDRVERLGAVSDEQLFALYRGADLFVMPNIPVPGDIEGFGIVMLEANLSGMPVLAAAVDGVQEVVSEGRNGVLVRALDAAAFAGAIERLRNDEAARLELGRRAEAHARSGYGWAGIARQHAEALRRAALGLPQPGPQPILPAAPKLSPESAIPRPRSRRMESTMPQHVITVAPTSEGWAVRSGTAEPLVFESSAQAVWAARKVGEAAAAGGVAAEVRVLDRSGGEAGRYLCPAARELELT